jgi:tetratricopeptide (TPR) repeat protein
VESVQTDYIDSAVRGELDTLRLLVEETDGNVIAFVRYRRVTEREAGVRYLKEQLSLPVEERVLSEERQNPIALLDNLPDERRCLQFYDLEAALPEVTGYLNVNREAYADVPHALVFWVGEHGLREVATNAPDFWAWRSGVFDVRSERDDLSQSMSQVALADDVQFTDRGDLERRAELYEGLIEEYEGEDEKYTAQLRLKLSSISLMLRNLERAEEEARRAMVYGEQETEDEITAHARHNLGMVAQKWRDFEEAEDWYQKSAELSRHLDDEHLAAAVYHQLSVIAWERRNLEESEKWLGKSAKIVERLSNKPGAATTYHSLGMVAQKRRDFEEAEDWYQKSAEIEERLGNEHGAATTYHQLGMVAQARRDFEEAEEWLQKSMEISERLDDEYLAATTHGQRGKLARERENFRDAGAWFLEAIQGFLSTDDSSSVQQALLDFTTTFHEAPPDVRDDLRQQWIDAGLPPAQLDEVIEQIRAEEGN